MNKQDLISAVSKRMWVAKNLTTEFIDSFLATITQSLEAGEWVKLTWFGTFKIVTRKARNGVNPKTLKAIKIPAMKSVSFKVSSVLRKIARGIK